MGEAGERRTVHYRGQVQGVGFRYQTRQLATGRRITGYVKNLPNGEVELVVEGSTREIDRFLAAIADRMSRGIADATARTSPATGEFDAFEITH